MKQVTTIYYCDRCGQKMMFPVAYLRRKTIKFIGTGIDFEVCGDCIRDFKKWWNAERNKEVDNVHKS